MRPQAHAERRVQFRALYFGLRTRSRELYCIVCEGKPNSVFLLCFGWSAALGWGLRCILKGMGFSFSLFSVELLKGREGEWKGEQRFREMEVTRSIIGATFSVRVAFHF